jgi:hypothetical protein
MNSVVNGFLSSQSASNGLFDSSQYDEVAADYDIILSAHRSDGGEISAAEPQEVSVGIAGYGYHGVHTS